MEKYLYTQNWFLVSELKKNLNKLNKFVDRTNDINILEIGSYEGLSSVFFADNFLEREMSSLTCVDPFLRISNNDHAEYLKNNQEKNFDINITRCDNSEKIKVFKITSDEFFANNRKKFNLIYIDGCHEPEFISRDIENGFKCLEENGIMWMNDYGKSIIAVKKEMNKFLIKHRGEYETIHQGYQLAIQKNKIEKEETPA
jgi:predicted O-methyltransferase YrrM|uniref:Methyltransferase n=1 Tax=viral metagenome TaxID=1070528 RepID=A0A6C0LWG4_9ZZZZ